MMKITKNRAIELYLLFLTDYNGCGMDMNDAQDLAKERVVSAEQIGLNKFIIKIKDDTCSWSGQFGFSKYCFELISFTKKNTVKSYKSLVKRRHKFYKWSDSNYSGSVKEEKII